MQNILSKFNKEKDFFLDPFPHIILDNPIDDNEYKILSKEYEEFEKYFHKMNEYNENNKRLQFSDKDFNKLNFKAPCWEKFLKIHTSQEFFQTLVGIFYDNLIELYPDLNEELKKVLSDKSIYENSDEIKLLCQPGSNTPVYNKNTFNRGPHIEKPNTLIAGLFYLKKDDDESKGGDFIINKKIGKVSFVPKAEVKEVNNVITSKEVRYTRNKVVFFLNSLNSIHSVSIREKTNHCRRLVNFNLKYYGPKKTFKINYSKNFFKSLLNKFF